MLGINSFNLSIVKLGLIFHIELLSGNISLINNSLI